MKKYIIIIFALTLLPMSIGAEITLRKGTRSTIIRTQQRVQPTNRNNFDAIYAIQPEKKNISYQHNSYTKPQNKLRKGMMYHIFQQVHKLKHQQNYISIIVIMAQSIINMMHWKLIIIVLNR